MWAGRLPKDQLTLCWHQVQSGESFLPKQAFAMCRLYMQEPQQCLQTSLSSGQYSFVAMRYIVLVLFRLTSLILVSAVCYFVWWEQTIKRKWAFRLLFAFSLDLQKYFSPRSACGVLLTVYHFVVSSHCSLCSFGLLGSNKKYILRGS